MFQQMQAMAQKQVIVATLSVVSCVHAFTATFLMDAGRSVSAIDPSEMSLLSS